MLSIILLIIGIGLLIKGADFLVDGAASVARKFEISDLAIGLTVVAFGTSTPELFVNLAAIISNKTDIAIANVIGSNISNILLILGIASIIYPLKVSKGTVWKEIPLSLLAALMLGVLINDNFFDKCNFSALTRSDGFVFISLFIIFIYYSFSIAKKIAGMNEHTPKKEYGILKSFLLIISGLVGLSLGGKWIIDGAVFIATKLKVSQSFIGLTIVAVGSSLPELAASATAAYKKNVEIAVGSVVGSNIFNIFFVLGISSIIKSIPFKTSHNISILVLIFVNLLLFIYMFTGKKRRLDRWEGIIFIILYLVYIIFLVMNKSV